jgi:hypothetical protein
MIVARKPLRFLEAGNTVSTVDGSTSVSICDSMSTQVVEALDTTRSVCDYVRNSVSMTSIAVSSSKLLMAASYALRNSLVSTSVSPTSMAILVSTANGTCPQLPRLQKTTSCALNGDLVPFPRSIADSKSTLKSNSLHTTQKH